MSHEPAAAHPYWLVRELIKSWPDPIETLNFSYYRYQAQSLDDPRRVFAVSAQAFEEPREIQKIIADVPEEHELAFHSRVSIAHGRVMHIPLIDMSTASAAQLEKLRPFLGSMFHKFQWFKSGRSFHGYASTLIDVDAWAATMGVLLLANQKGLTPTVDPRWVGHRLIAGYSSLRWTKNTDYYIEEPRALNQSRLPGTSRGATS